MLAVHSDLTSFPEDSNRQAKKAYLNETAQPTGPKGRLGKRADNGPKEGVLVGENVFTTASRGFVDFSR
jgi:hypothetical protein